MEWMSCICLCMHVSIIFYCMVEHMSEYLYSLCSIVDVYRNVNVIHTHMHAYYAVVFAYNVHRF